MDGMMAILDRMFFELGEAQKAGLHGLARCRTKEEMRKDIGKMAEAITKVERLMKYGYKEDKLPTSSQAQ